MTAHACLALSIKQSLKPVKVAVDGLSALKHSLNRLGHVSVKENLRSPCHVHLDGHQRSLHSGHTPWTFAILLISTDARYKASCFISQAAANKACTSELRTNGFGQVMCLWAKEGFQSSLGRHVQPVGSGSFLHSGAGSMSYGAGWVAECLVNMVIDRMVGQSAHRRWCSGICIAQGTALSHALLLALSSDCSTVMMLPVLALAATYDLNSAVHRLCRQVARTSCTA